MTRIAIIAALSREVAPLVSRGQWQRTKSPAGISLWITDSAVVALAGMGTPRATLAFQAALATGPLSSVLSVGWAGACAPGAEVGAIVRPSTVVNAQTGERYACTDGDGSVLASVSSFAGTAEKQRLHAAYNATTVEMEAAAVARLAQAHSLPFRAIKAISDAADFDFPEITRFHSADGQFREATFALFVAFRPSLWKPVLHMAKGSKLAAENLCAALEAELQSRDSET